MWSPSAAATAASLRSSLSSVRALLVDLSGTVHVEDEAIPGAVDAVQKLKEKKFPVKFVTNTTKESQRRLHERLTRLGFPVSSSDIFTSLSAARRYVEENKLRPMLMLEDAAMEDFEAISTDDPTCVVVGLAPSQFHYERLNEAFRLLKEKEGAKLVAIHKAKYYERKDGLAIGPGFFAAGLEYSTGCQAVVVGKPEAAFFHSAVAALNSELGTDITENEVLMIGDDIAGDVTGAQNAGLRGCLVKTGKYRPGDEEGRSPDFVFDSFTHCVDALFSTS